MANSLLNCYTQTANVFVCPSQILLEDLLTSHYSCQRAQSVSPDSVHHCFWYSVRSIHYCRLSLNSCHNAVRLLFRCSLLACHLFCSICSAYSLNKPDLQNDFPNSVSFILSYFVTSRDVSEKITRRMSIFFAFLLASRYFGLAAYWVPLLRQAWRFFFRQYIGSPKGNEP